MKISKNLPPFIIAEMSGNHNQSLERAMLIIEEAAKAGADAIKFQTYTPDTMTLNCRKKDFIGILLQLVNHKYVQLFKTKILLTSFGSEFRSIESFNLNC